jgi:hypothetical protein
MILHIGSLAALFVDQLGPVPVVANCAQAAPGPDWKWWVSALIGPLLSGLVSIYVAWRVFRWQSEKDRNAWIRDQRTVEWKGLIQAVAELEEIMPLGEVGSSAVDGIRYKVLPLCNRISHVISQALFVAPVLSDHGVQPEIYQLMRDTDSAIGRIEAFFQSSQDDKMKLGTPVGNAMEIRGRLQNLHAKLVSLARADLSLD